MSAARVTRATASAGVSGDWYADASTLGIAPGASYPAQLATDLGNGQPFAFVRFDGNQTAHYRQLDGTLILKVWND